MGLKGLKSLKNLRKKFSGKPSATCSTPQPPCSLPSAPGPMQKRCLRDGAPFVSRKNSCLFSYLHLINQMIGSGKYINYPEYVPDINIYTSLKIIVESDIT